MGLIRGLRRSPGGGNGKPLYYPCLKNPMDREAWLQSMGSQRGGWEDPQEEDMTSDLAYTHKHIHTHMCLRWPSPRSSHDGRPGRQPRLPLGGGPRLKAINVDLQSDAALQVDISDALSERDKVKFTVHTKSSLLNFKQNEFSVVRQHEEFIWLHDSFIVNEDYAGYIIPPAPPRPDFDASREKLQKLGEGEGSMTKEEFTKMKQELEAEYLATFKKTVAMHEVFLCRVAAHPILRKDLNFHVFLEYNQDLSVRGKNKKEKLEDFFKNMVKSADGVIVSGVKVRHYLVNRGTALRIYFFYKGDTLRFSDV